MKSRLLLPPIATDSESDDLFSSVPARRVEDVAAPKVEEQRVVESKPTPSQEPYVTPVRSAPQVSARPQGRFVVAAILVVCVCLLASLLWSTFLRDAAYGVVAGKVSEISPAWPGTLTAVYVQSSDRVRQGDVLAIVSDPELQVAIDKLGDDLRAAQAELDAKVAMLAVESRRRGNAAEEIRADYFDMRGELQSEQARYDEMSSKLARRQELAKQRAISNEEIESLRILQRGLAAKIENMQRAVTALESRLEPAAAEMLETAQLKPWLAKIENYQAEIHRLREKQRRGTILAPFDGTIVEATRSVGERVTPEQSLLELLPVDGLEVVLYVSQNEVESYRVGQQLQVIVDPLSESFGCEITRIGQRFETPLAHVPGRYRVEEKLLPVYLSPPAALSTTLNLRIGSTVRLPATLFGNAN